MRGLLRIVLASNAEHLDIEAARLEKLLRDMDAAEERESRSVHELESEQERLSARTYDLDAELRQTQNLLSQTALDLDRAENRITFNREQVAQLESRASQLSFEIEQAVRQAADLSARIDAQRESVAALRALDTSPRIAPARIHRTRFDQLHRARASSNRAWKSFAASPARWSRNPRAGRPNRSRRKKQPRAIPPPKSSAPPPCAPSNRNAPRSQSRVDASDAAFAQAEQHAQSIGATVREAQSRLAGLRQTQQETSQQLEQVRQELSAERARHASIEQILRERAYTADAVQKLFNANGDAASRGFRALGLLADYAEVQEEYETAIEQFLRDELEYVVVESFDQARAGVRFAARGSGRPRHVLRRFGPHP